MDFRLLATALSVILGMAGYIILVLSNHTAEAGDLLQLIVLPSLTFIIGLGSKLVN